MVKDRNCQLLRKMKNWFEQYFEEVPNVEDDMQISRGDQECSWRQEDACVGRVE